MAPTGITWATPADVRSRWIGTDPLPSDEVIQTWLADAELLIFSEYPHLADKTTDDATGQWRQRIITVEVQLTSQALKNPDGIRSRMRVAGAFTDSTTYGTETIGQIMQLTPAHRALLTDRSRGGRHVGIDMTAETPDHHLLARAWVNGPGGLAPGENPP